MAVFRGTVHIYGDNIDTDRIIPGKYTKTLDARELAAHVLEDLDPTFAARVKQGDIVAAGENFGCGSSREQAAIALKAAGVAVVVARSFARIFYRNAINIGLPLVEAAHELQANSEVSIDLSVGKITDHTTGRTYTATQMPAAMIAILDAGGLVNYLREHGGYGDLTEAGAHE